MESVQKQRTVLHTVARTPVRVTRQVPKLPGEKQADMLAQYQAMMLDESSSTTPGPAAPPLQLRLFPTRDSDVDPVQDNFTRALRLKLESYINKAPGLRAVPALATREARVHSSMGASPKARDALWDMRGRLSDTKGTNLPRLNHHEKSVEPRKGKLSALDVLRNQESGKFTANYHYRTKSLLSSLGFRAPDSHNAAKRSTLCADFKHSLAPSPPPQLNSKMIDLSAPTPPPASIYHLREHIIPSRYDSKRPTAPKKRSQSSEYQSMEFLKAHKGAKMEKMYETVMCEFQLDANLVPDDLRSVRYIGTHNIFNSHL